MSTSLPHESPSLACPNCQKNLRWTDEFPFRPFCSERCKLIDLGDWASETHRIAGEPDLTGNNDDY